MASMKEMRSSHHPKSMEIFAGYRVYNGWGPDNTFTPVGRYLASEHPNFGSAIKEIELTVYLANHGHPKTTLESHFERHTEIIATLPKSKFFRKKARLEISYLTALGDARLADKYKEPDPALFSAATHEMAAHIISALQGKVTKADHFDLGSFTTWIHNRLQTLPQSQAVLKTLIEDLAREFRRKRDARSPWDALDIDWAEFHPKAREVLDDPFLWNCIDDDAPHGNDTGADVLSLYTEERARTGQPLGLDFLDGLLNEWGVNGEQVREDATIGLAFAQLKIEGRCDDSVRSAALDCIAQRRLRWATEASDAQSDQTEQPILDLLEKKLKA